MGIVWHEMAYGLPHFCPTGLPIFAAGFGHPLVAIQKKTLSASYSYRAGKRSLSMKRDRAMEELRTLVLPNNPKLTAADLDVLTDLQLLERVRNSIILDEQGRQIDERESAQMRAFLDRLIKKYRSKPILH